MNLTKEVWEHHSRVFPTGKKHRVMLVLHGFVLGFPHLLSNMLILDSHFYSKNRIQSFQPAVGLVAKNRKAKISNLYSQLNLASGRARSPTTGHLLWNIGRHLESVIIEFAEFCTFYSSTVVISFSLCNITILKCQVWMKSF